MVNSKRLLIIAGCALVLAACAPGINEQHRTFVPAPRADQSSLLVHNNFFGEVDVYVINGSIRSRIGSVPTAGTASFRIPGTFLVRTQIQFQVDPIGPEEPFNYRPLAVNPGNDVELSVAPALQMSSYAIVVSR